MLLTKPTQRIKAKIVHPTHLAMRAAAPRRTETAGLKRTTFHVTPLLIGNAMGTDILSATNYPSNLGFHPGRANMLWPLLVLT